MMLQVSLSPNEVLISLFSIQATTVCCSSPESLWLLGPHPPGARPKTFSLSPHCVSLALAQTLAVRSQEQRGLLVGEVPDAGPLICTGRTRSCLC